MTTVFETEKTAIWLKADPEGTERRLGIDKKKGYASCCWWKDRTEAALAVEPELVLGSMLTGGVGCVITILWREEFIRSIGGAFSASNRQRR